MIEAGDLLTHYSFDLGGATAEQLLDRWLRRYPVHWVRAAVIEALYQGRYKAVSVEQILLLWYRRGHPIYHFNHEFERIVCNHFPRNLTRPVEALNSADEQGDHSAALTVRLETAATTIPDGTEINASAIIDPNAADRVADEDLLHPSEPSTLEVLCPETLTDPLPETAAFSASRKLEGNDAQLEVDLAPFGLDLSDPFALSRGEAAKHPIDSFVPTADEESDFYTKLRAVAHGEEPAEREGVAIAIEPPSRRASNSRPE